MQRLVPSLSLSAQPLCQFSIALYLPRPCFSSPWHRTPPMLRPELSPLLEAGCQGYKHRGTVLMLWDGRDEQREGRGAIASLVTGQPDSTLMFSTEHIIPPAPCSVEYPSVDGAHWHWVFVGEPLVLVICSLACCDFSVWLYVLSSCVVFLCICQPATWWGLQNILHNTCLSPRKVKKNKTWY